VRLVSASSGWQGDGESPPALTFDFRGTIAENGKTDRGEAWFYGGGAAIGRLLYHYSRLVGPQFLTPWETQARLSTDDVATTVDSGTDHDGTTNANVYEVLEATADDRRYAMVTSSRAETGEGGGELTEYDAWQYPKIIGVDDLELQGTWPEVGFTAAQMLEQAIPRFSYLNIPADGLESDGFVIPQAWFGEGTDLASIVKELTKYELLDWFVLNGKVFEIRRPGTYGRRWQAYSGPSNLREAGLDGSRLWRSIVVRYQDVDGTTKTVGPIGSGAEVETTALEITDPDHPAVKAGIIRKDVLDLQGAAVLGIAEAAGERWLQDANELDRSGSADLTGHVMDDKGIFRPVSQVQPGDHIRFPDASDTSYRKIVAAQKDHDNRSCNVTLDAPPEGVQALLERFQASLVPIAIS
jgi:hypothetical protein